MRNEPNFFLTTAGETDVLASPRACWVQHRLRDVRRDDHLLVRFGPALIGQPYGLKAQDIDTLILSAKHEGVTLSPVSEWPCHVYVSRLLDDRVLETGVFSAEQVEMLGWGAIFQTADAALDYAKMFDRAS